MQKESQGDRFPGQSVQGTCPPDSLILQKTPALYLRAGALHLKQFIHYFSASAIFIARTFSGSPNRVMKP